MPTWPHHTWHKAGPQRLLLPRTQPDPFGADLRLLPERDQRHWRHSLPVICCAFKNNERRPPSATPPLVRGLCHRTSCQDTLQLTACSLHGPKQTGAGERLPESLSMCPLTPAFLPDLFFWSHLWHLLLSLLPMASLHPSDRTLGPPGPQNLPWAPEAWIPRPLAQAATSQFGRLYGVHGKLTIRTGLLPPLPQPCCSLPTSLDRASTGSGQAEAESEARRRRHGQ